MEGIFYLEKEDTDPRIYKDRRIIRFDRIVCISQIDITRTPLGQPYPGCFKDKILCSS